MRNNRLRQFIALQRNTPSLQSFETASNWTTYAEVWANRLEPKGDEVVAALQVQSEMTMVFRIYYRSDVTPTDRVLMNSRPFDIKAVTNPDGREKWLMLHCVEHKSSGD